MVDYLDQFSSPNQNKDTLSLFHKRLISDVPDFKTIRDVADVSKRARLNPQKAIPRTVSTARQISRQPGLFEAPFGSGVFGEASVVVVVDDENNVSELKPAIENVLAMWAAKVRE